MKGYLFFSSGSCCMAFKARNTWRNLEYAILVAGLEREYIERHHGGYRHTVTFAQ